MSIGHRVNTHILVVSLHRKRTTNTKFKKKGLTDSLGETYEMLRDETHLQNAKVLVPEGAFLELLS